MNSEKKHIRVVFPMWQGGNNPVYQFGAELLAWLAPATSSPVIRIPVTLSSEPVEVEDGIAGRRQIREQLLSAENRIRAQSPDTLAVLGGDCLVDLVPFAWLSEKYQEGFGILWIDTHPDVMTPAQFQNAHAHVLGALMGYGDADLTARVSTPVPPSRVMIAGIHGTTDYETDFLKKHPINTCTPEEVREGTEALKEWIQREKITRLAIHFDLDVLDERYFKSLLFLKPDADEHAFDGIARGKLTLSDVAKWIQDAAELTEVVGLGVTEFFPWDAIRLKELFSRLPLISQ